MADLSIEYAGISLRSPMIVGSSGLTDSIEKNIFWEKAGIGAIVLKSLFEEQIEHEATGFLIEKDYPEARKWVHNYLRENKVMEYLELIRGTKKYTTIPLVASINCYSTGGWIDFACQIESAGADALELNITDISADPRIHPMETQERYLQIVRAVRTAIDIPLIVKSGRHFGNIPWLVNQLKEAGANGVILFNRLYQPDIDIYRTKVTSGRVYSVREELGETLRWIALTSGKVDGIDLCASTGVHHWNDIIKCLLAGASAVQLVSALYLDKKQRFLPDAIQQMNKWMDDKGLERIEDFKGKLKDDGSVNAAIFERAQFMKYFSNHKP